MYQQPLNSEQSQEKELVSIFNEAKFQILRLHTLWQICNTQSRRGDLYNWNYTLDRVWVELSTDALKKDKNIKEDKEKNFLKFKEFNQIILQAKQKQDRAKEYLTLMEKEIFLRNLQDSAGKGSVMHDKDQDEDFDM